MFTPEWHHRAACRTTDPELFFPISSDPASENAAKRVCRGCPVTALCLDEAIDNGIHHGVWGGLGPDERRNLQRRVRRHAIAHPPVVKGEKECGDCKETLPVGMFSTATQNRDGLSSFCKPCLAERARKRRDAKAVA